MAFFAHLECEFFQLREGVSAKCVLCSSQSFPMLMWCTAVFCTNIDTCTYCNSGDCYVPCWYLQRFLLTARRGLGSFWFSLYALYGPWTQQRLVYSQSKETLSHTWLAWLSSRSRRELRLLPDSSMSLQSEHSTVKQRAWLVRGSTHDMLTHTSTLLPNVCKWNPYLNYESNFGVSTNLEDSSIQGYLMHVHYI